MVEMKQQPKTGPIIGGSMLGILVIFSTYILIRYILQRRALRAKVEDPEKAAPPVLDLNGKTVAPGEGGSSRDNMVSTEQLSTPSHEKKEQSSTGENSSKSSEPSPGLSSNEGYPIWALRSPGILPISP